MKTRAIPFQVMVPRDKLMTGGEQISLKEAYEILEHEKKGERERDRERERERQR